MYTSFRNYHNMELHIKLIWGLTIGPSSPFCPGGPAKSPRSRSQTGSPSAGRTVLVSGVNVVARTTELFVGFAGVFGFGGMTPMLFGMGGMCLGACLVLVGTFLVGIGFSSLEVVGTLLDKDIDKFNWCLVELTVGGTGEGKTFAGIFFLVVSGGGLEGEGLGGDPLGIIGLMTTDFAVEVLAGFTSAGLKATCFELVGVDIAVGFMLTGFDTLLVFELEGFVTLVSLELLSFDALVGFGMKAFEMLVCFVPLGFEALMGFKTVGFGIANMFNGFAVTVLA